MSLNRLLARRVRRAALALCAAAVLTACGGGDRSEPFTPGRIFAFGDELSVLDDSASAGNGLKYSVNGFNSTSGALDCGVYPIWIQTLANSFSMGFKQCPSGYGNLNAVTRAQVGARVAQLRAQVDTYLASDKPVENDLVTMLVGSNDVLDAYAAWKAGSLNRDAALAQVRAAAEVLAAQVNRVVQAGPAVLVASVPYLGASPYAYSQDAVVGGARQMLLDLTQAFNDALVSGGEGAGSSKGLASYGLTGKDYGLIQTGTSWIKAIAENTNSDTVAFNTTALCNVALPNCNTNTFNANGDVNNWVWADATHPAYAFQLQLGSRAATMAGPRGLPF